MWFVIYVVVLILVLMDNVNTLTGIAEASSQMCLNPCFNG